MQKIQIQLEFKDTNDTTFKKIKVKDWFFSYNQFYIKKHPFIVQIKNKTETYNAVSTVGGSFRYFSPDEKVGKLKKHTTQIR